MRARAADGQVFINTVAYAYRSVQRTGRVNPIDVSNSEGIPGNPAGAPGVGFSSTLPDLRGCEFTLTQAVFVDELNPYAAPINLREGNYYDLAFSPSEDTDVPATGNYLCVETSEQGTVNQGALIPSARFRSDSVYNGPGET